MLTIREFHIEEKIRNDIKQMLTESNTINDEADTAAGQLPPPKGGGLYPSNPQ